MVGIWLALVCITGCKSLLESSHAGRLDTYERQRERPVSGGEASAKRIREMAPVVAISRVGNSLEEPFVFEAPLEGRLKRDELEMWPEKERLDSPWMRLWSDQKNFYSPESLTLLGSGLAVGGGMANTSIDAGIQRHFQTSVRGATSDEWFETLHASKELGNGMYTLPVFASAWVAGELLPDSTLAETGGLWGERSLRSFVVGAPPLIALQQLTGGSRPYESSSGSNWQPFQDVNGVSGHSFMGSLPFITAAKMTDNKAYKTLFYAGSAIAPLSRVNDNAHYPSQVALGWWIAYLAASAVHATDNPESKWRFYPYLSGSGTGLMAEWRF